MTGDEAMISNTKLSVFLITLLGCGFYRDWRTSCERFPWKGVHKRKSKKQKKQSKG